jgi:hypothetical protein
LAATAYVVKSTDDVTGELTYETYADDSNCPAGLTRCTGQAIEAGQAPAMAETGPVNPVPKPSTPAIARLRNYKTVIDFIRRVATQLGFYGPEWRGVTR